MTDSERLLWSRLRGKQLLGVQFYRQKPVGNYVVDFFAPRTSLVVEVDGSQHREDRLARADRRRDAYLASLGLEVLRFDSRQVLQDSEAVVTVIFQALGERLKGDHSPTSQIPPFPPLIKGGG